MICKLFSQSSPWLALAAGHRAARLVHGGTLRKQFTEPTVQVILSFSTRCEKLEVVEGTVAGSGKGTRAYP